MLNLLGRTVLRSWLIFAVVASLAATILETRGTGPSQTNFGLFYASAHAATIGQDPYAIFRTVGDGQMLPNLNPPIWTVIFIPLTFLPLDQAELVWISISALAFCGLALATILRGWGAWRSWRLLALLAGPVIWETFSQGQVYAFNVLFLAATSLCLRLRRYILTAAILGLAIALKPQLAVLVLSLFVVHRRLAIFTTSFAIFWTLLPFPIVGPQAYLSWLKVTQMAPVVAWQNASVYATATRLAGPRAGLLVGAAIVVATVLLCRRARDVESAIELGICGALAASPITWPTYFGLLWPGFLRFGREHRFSRVFDAALLFSSIPYWLLVLSNVLVPVYSLALAGFCFEAIRLTFRATPATEVEPAPTETYRPEIVAV